MEHFKVYHGKVLRCEGCGQSVMRGPSEAAFRAQHASCGYYGAGDMVARATSAAGIRPCGGCKQRQAAMNAAMPRMFRR